MPGDALSSHEGAVAVLSRTSATLQRQLGTARGVLFDRDDTLIFDVPRYNGDPMRVTPIPGARNAVARLRAAGYKLGVVSNQSGIGRGNLSPEQVKSVNGRVEQLVGPMDTWRYCPHTPLDSCYCRRPGPRLILGAAADLGLAARQVVVVGDVASDVLAAQRAGAVGILVPSSRTLKDEIRQAPLVAPNLGRAVELILAARAARTLARSGSS